MSFIRVTYRNIGECLLIEAKITQKMVSCVIKAHPNMRDKAGNMEAADNSTDSSVDLNFFQAAQLVSRLPGNCSVP